MDYLPDAALSWSWLRAGGPGGQHQNKTETAVQLRYSIPLGGLPEDAAERLRKLSGSRLTQADEIVIEARSHRSREMNRREALEKLHELIRDALKKPVKRRKTRPTKASRERRLTEKKQLSEKKALRRQIPPVEH
jgi:ribosome-associated protein